jgi:SAM-dependent methyltransferase
MGVVGGPGNTSWGESDVVSEFVSTEGVSDAGEAAALALLDDVARGDVLDLGVGAGRTTGLLLPGAKTYTGIDISSEMIDVARAKFPGADLRVGDARDLDALGPAAYDLVVFSFNGLDALGRGDRGLALSAMARAVRPGGRVLFSSLNLDGVSFDERPWRLPGGLRSARGRFHVARAIRQPSTVLRSLRNFRRTRDEGADGEGWATRPLRAHEFRFVVHFATLARSVADARGAGLEVVAAYADDGTPVDPAAGHVDADYVHFVCRVA